MKKFIASATLSLLAIGAFAQGQINLISNGAGRPIYGVNKSDIKKEFTIDDIPNRDKLGRGYIYEIWYAPGADRAESDLLPLVSGEFSKNGVFVKSGSVEIPRVWGGDPVTFQVRAWAYDPGVTTWTDIFIVGSITLARGKSELFTKAAGGRNAAGEVVLPLSLVGAFESFGLFAPIPEPSVISLSVLGLGSLMLRRRK